jgi:hypothetical protein
MPKKYTRTYTALGELKITEEDFLLAQEIATTEIE